MTEISYVFDATQHDPDAGQEPVPADTYKVAIDSAETYEMRDDKGWGFKVVYKIVDGPYAGRTFHNQYNIGHQTSPKTVEIAHKQLSALAHVVGVMKFDVKNKGGELVGKQLRARVLSDGRYNELKEVYDVNGNKPSKAGSGIASGAPVAAAAPGGWGATPAAVVAPAAAPAAPVAAPAPMAVFPPADWTPHPQAPGYFYQGTEVLSEADLRARLAPPVAPAAPAVAPAWGAQPAAAPAIQPAGQPAAPWGARPAA